GWDGTQYVTAGRFLCSSNQTWTVGANGAFCSIFTTPNGSGTPVEIVRLQASGGVTIGGTFTNDPGAGGLPVQGRAGIPAANSITSQGQAGIGYQTGAGAGGTVTQATSKSTGVTLNKITGAITMNAAALAAATSVTFTVTDSSVAATDAVVAN